jgi:cyclic-di-AMP phosphodiesterase PgpH
MSSGSSAKTRSDRAASLKFRPGTLALVWRLLHRRQVWAQVGLCALMILLLLLVTRSGTPPFAYRSGHLPDRDLLARMSFSVVTERGESHQFHEGELLAPGGRPLSTGDIQKLYAEHTAIHSQQGVWHLLARVMASIGIYVLLTVICGWYLHIHHRLLLEHTGRLAVLAASVVVIVLLSRVGSSDAWRAESIPLILFGMTIAIVFDRPLALLLTVAVSLVVSLSLGFSLPKYLLVTSSVVVPTLMVARIRSRTRLIHIGVVSGGIVLVATLCISGIAGQAFGLSHWTHVSLVDGGDLVTRWSFAQRVLYGAAWYGVCVVLAGFLMTGLLPFMERALDFQTDIRLLELGDAAHPVLRQLAQRAPGTYNHSINVASIAEAAAEAIQADGLLVRVASYFHDIGKMFKPEYFIENQSTAGNQHDSLVPAMSTLVIIAHVKDGANLARQHRLPRSIIDLLEQHHGTTLVEYFFRQATLQHENAPDSRRPDETNFRYPGPRPRTREAAVLMMADAVESACRSLTDPTPSRIESLVNEIGLKRLLDGQFAECNLTLQDLNAIQESLVKSLTAVYHGRIKYPSQQTA